MILRSGSADPMMKKEALCRQKKAVIVFELLSAAMIYPRQSCQNATALAAATFSESTPSAIGIVIV